jgi:hypothetical protein
MLSVCLSDLLPFFFSAYQITATPHDTNLQHWTLYIADIGFFSLRMIIFSRFWLNWPTSIPHSFSSSLSLLPFTPCLPPSHFSSSLPPPHSLPLTALRNPGSAAGFNFGLRGLVNLTQDPSSWVIVANSDIAFYPGILQVHFYVCVCVCVY